MSESAYEAARAPPRGACASSCTSLVCSFTARAGWRSELRATATALCARGRERWPRLAGPAAYKPFAVSKQLRAWLRRSDKYSAAGSGSCCRKSIDAICCNPLPRSGARTPTESLAGEEQRRHSVRLVEEKQPVGGSSRKHASSGRLRSGNDGQLPFLASGAGVPLLRHEKG